MTKVKRYLKRKILYLKRKFIPLSIPELIDITLENQYLFQTGLCSWVYNLYVYNILTFNEYNKFIKCIRENGEDKSRNVFWWKEGDIQPRIEFLEQLKQSKK